MSFPIHGDVLCLICNCLCFDDSYNLFQTCKTIRTSNTKWESYIFDNLKDEFKLVYAVQMNNRALMNKLITLNKTYINIALKKATHMPIIYDLLKYRARMPTYAEFEKYKSLNQYRTGKESGISCVWNMSTGITLGYACSNNNSGSNNIIIGYNSNVISNEINHSIIFGVNATAVESNQLVLGSATNPINVTQDSANGKNYLKVLLNGRRARIPIEWDD